jgi:hypothetical protein
MLTLGRNYVTYAQRHLELFKIYSGSALYFIKLIIDRSIPSYFLLSERPLLFRS